MVEEAQSDEIGTTLASIEALQLREAEVLRAMDHDALDALTAEKEVLGERLRALTGGQKVGERHRALLERVRKQATMNQLLLVHARDAIRTILSEVTGTSFETMPNQSRKSGGFEGLRLNVKL